MFGRYSPFPEEFLQKIKENRMGSAVVFTWLRFDGSNVHTLRTIYGKFLALHINVPAALAGIVAAVLQIDR
jgi:hypothetical protein